jgi:5'-3' exonuclease
MLEAGATHVAVATDHVIKSFRNDLWPGYKDGSDLEPAILAQFGILEDALRGLGVVVWAMVEHEADDGLGAGAAMAAADNRVEQVLICTPDKDLTQCVVGTRVIQFDRRRRQLIDEDAVVEKFGVSPASIPDYLALVGDASDGFPGVKGWGAKSSATVLARYGHLEAIPRAAADWEVAVRSAPNLAAALVEQWENALLFRHLATVVRDAPVTDTVDELVWSGPRRDFGSLCELIQAPTFVRRAEQLAMR